MRSAALLALLFGGLLAGCSSLLPFGSDRLHSPFSSYAEAERAVQRITPYATRVEELPALGFDPAAGRNVTRIPYPNVIGRVVSASGVPMEALDEGVQACILAQARCHGYLFRFEHKDHARVGNFLADFINVRRTTHYTGWWFEALVVVRGDTVLFSNVAGEPRTERTEKDTNPLGPFQPADNNARILLN
jgi:hypothetical protein